MRPSLLPLLVAILVVVTATFPEEAAAAWTPIANPNSLLIQQVGRFAVIVHNLTRRKSLVFVSVVRGETEQPAAPGAGGGTNYRLVLAALSAPGGSKVQYQCLVWGVPGSRTNTWKLLSFK